MYDLEDLRAFVAVADKLSFSEAASELYVTQPTLSRRISKLEAEMGIQLFVRGTPLQITQEGLAVLHEVRILLKHLNEFSTRVDQIRTQHASTLRVASNSGDLSVFYRAVDVMSVKHPEVQLVFDRICGSVTLNALLHGELDLLLTYSAEMEGCPGIEFVPLFDLQPGFLMPQSDALAKKKSLTVADLHQRRVVTWRPGVATRTFEQLEARCREVGATPQLDPLAGSRHELVCALVSGGGLAFAFRELLPEHPRTCVFRPLSDLGTSLSFGMAFATAGRTNIALMNLVQALREAGPMLS